MLACRLPVGDSLVCEAGFLSVVGENLGKRPALCLLSLENRLVELTPATLQKDL